MARLDLLVVGGGPAGLSAASEACKNGLKVLVVDEGIKMGGQLVKQSHKFFGNEDFYASVRGYEISDKLIKRLENYSNVEIMTQASVIGIYEDGVAILDRKRDITSLHHPSRIVIATGASEKYLQFDNNDLPGVYGAGAVQTLMNQFGVIPGNNILMIGSGNIGLIVAYQLAQAGVNIKGIVEASNKIGGYEVHYNKIKRLGIPVYLKNTILKAIGKERVEGAVIAEVDENWKVVSGTEREIVVDTICLSIGLSPTAELVAQSGGKLAYVGELGGYIPIHNEDMKTTVENVFVAGDAGGIEEATTAMIEGKIAGLAVVRDLLGVTNEEKIIFLKKRLEEFRSGPTSEKVRRGLEKSGLDFKESRAISFNKNEPDKYFGKLRPIIECSQAIPCNPCETSCPVGAITVGKNINSLPLIDYEKCSGCGICATKCPGLAIFMLQEDPEKNTAILGIPYEFLPLPVKGQEVLLLNRNGAEVGTGKVVRVTKPANRTNLVYVEVPLNLANEVRHLHAFSEVNSDFVCRCEEVTVGQIEKALEKGYTDYEELRRYLRLSMGPCGGRTCRLNTLLIMSRKLGVPVEKLNPGTYRPPAVPTTFKSIAEGDETND